MRVLIVKTTSLGDVIHTLPAVTDAATARPGLRFDWVVEEPFAEIPAWHPAVDTVLPVALRRWRKTLWRESTRSEWKQFRRELQRGHYDAVIDAQGLLKSAVITRLVQAPRYGLDKDSAREPLASRAYHHAVAVPRDLHAVERTRMLFAAALGYEVPPGRGDYGVRAGLKDCARAPVPSLLFFHGTARAEKLWPEERWVELAALAGASGYTVWLPWGSDAEQARARRIAERADSAEVLPRLDLKGIASLLMEVDGAVAVDTGLGHLAAALDVPTVSLYGPTQVGLIGAYGANQLHIQSPVTTATTEDAEAMMRAIEAPVVWAGLESILPGEDLRT